MIALTELRELDIVPERAGAPARFVSAASGLVCAGSTIYVVADDELHLGVFSRDTRKPGRLIRLLDGSLPPGKAERKQQKPDFEALTLLPALEDFPHGALLALGSGSRANRCRGVLLGFGEDGAIGGSPQTLDMSPIFSPLREAFAELNIEGAVVAGDELRLFQRGNRTHPDNAIIRYPLLQTLDAGRGASANIIRPLSIDCVDLGSIDGVPLCFTDASVLPSGDMAFCAVAEDTEDAYRDGPCIGAGIGILDSAGELLRLERLERPYKVEGISARPAGDRLDLLLVTDADDPAIPAMLLAGSIAR